MAFENVNVSSLRSALNSCKNSINYSGTDSTINTISNNNNWNSISRNKFKDGLTHLVNVDYKRLKDTLDRYYQIVNYIEDYKELQSENSSYNNQISKLNSEISNARDNTYTVSSGDTLSKIARANGTTVDAIMAINNIKNANVIYSGQIINLPGGTDVSGLKQQVSRLQKLINENNNKMENLKNKAYDLI